MQGIPDVSANGAEYRAWEGGVEYHFYGTSLAAPLWGSIITLVSDIRCRICTCVLSSTLDQRRTDCRW